MVGTQTMIPSVFSILRLILSINNRGVSNVRFRLQHHCNFFILDFLRFSFSYNKGGSLLSNFGKSFDEINNVPSRVIWYRNGIGIVDLFRWSI